VSWKTSEKDVMDQLTGAHRDAIEKVVSRLHVPPCPNYNPDVSAMSSHEIVDTFWNEFKVFQNRTNPYHDASHWASYGVMIGNSYLAREIFTSVHNSVRVRGMSCYIKALWNRSS
jgi:hypothetical protein